MAIEADGAAKGAMCSPVAKIHNPVFGDTGDGIDGAFALPIVADGRLGYFDDEDGCRRMMMGIVVRLTNDDGDVWLGL